jgi:hypothetical protein
MLGALRAAWREPATRDATRTMQDERKERCMAKIVKVRCTGSGQYGNEIDLEDVIGSDVVIYGGPIAAGRDLPAQIVRRCAVCDEGKVIVTREMIEKVL